MKKHILVADKIADEGVQYLEQLDDFKVDVIHGLDEAELCKTIPPYHAVLVRSAAKITGKVIDSGDTLQVIGRAGIGVDNIDVDKATEKGIAVLNTPDANATTTAELTFAHMLSVSRNLPAADRSVRAGKWERSRFIGAELAGKTLGIIGYGTIGRIVANRARAFGMDVLVYDPFVTEDVCVRDGILSLELEEMLPRVDYLTFHCPANEKTRGMLNAERMALMKRGARLINCARGGLVDEAALYDALKSGHLAGAALDVFETEPPAGSPLFELENIVFTPHLGASTAEAQTAAGTEIARQIAVYLRTGEPINAINLPPVSGEELAKLKPYMMLARRLGKLLGPMIDAPVKKLDVTLCGAATERDVRSITTEGLVGLISTHMSVPVNRVNARSIAEKQGIKLVDSMRDKHPDYHATVSLTAHFGDRQLSVEGTLFDQTYPRLVRVSNYDIEAVLDGHLILTRHIDQPGVVAAISSILAQQNINIQHMQMGVASGDNKAIAVLGIERPVDEATLKKIGEVKAIDKVMQVSL
ncbi:MAG: phosphoglycerate dehydrogenase [Gammaproteobacteria bacterium]